MVERVRNVIKTDHKKLNNPTLVKSVHLYLGDQRKVLLHRYPVSSYDIGDPATIDKAISDELKKGRPRDILLHICMVYDILNGLVKFLTIGFLFW